MAKPSALDHSAFAFDIDGDQVRPLGRERLLQRGNDILRLADDGAGDAHTLGHGDKIQFWQIEIHLGIVLIGIGVKPLPIRIHIMLQDAVFSVD